MHTCRHCGRENPKDATLCVECGLDLGPSAIEQGVSHVRARSGGFFRWRVASIFLILLTVAYGLTAPLNLWFAKLATQRDDLHATAREWFWGAVWNALVAMLCFVAWRLMRRQSREHFAGGACAVAVALVIVMRTWMAGLINGHNHFPAMEAVLTWLPMLYAMFYALRQCKRVAAA
jgi:hypothetical protein